MNKTDRTQAFIDMLLTLLEGENSLSKSLEILTRSGILFSIRRTALGILEAMRQGLSFSSAIEIISKDKKAKVFFSHLYITLISSAEKTGCLISVLSDINAIFIRKKQNRELLITVLIYPFIIIFIACTGTLLILFIAIPFFIQQGMTSIIAAESAVRGCIYSGLFLLISGFVLLCICRHFFETESVEFRIFYILKLLLMAEISLQIALSQCIENFGISKAGRALVTIKHDINSGVPLSRAFENSGFFSPFVIGWLTITDDRGEAVKIFENLSNYYRKKDQRNREILSRFIEPVVITMTGIYILIIVQTSILPILTRVGGFI